MLHKELLFSSVNLETTDLCRDYFCLSQGSACLQQEFDFSLFYWLLQDLSDCWRQAPIHIKVSCRYWKWRIGEGPNISCQVLNSNPFFLPLMLNIYFVCSIRGKDSCSVAWFEWALPPPACHSLLIYLLSKASPLHFCQSNFTAGSCQIQAQTSDGLEQFLSAKKVKDPRYNHVPRFLSSAHIRLQKFTPLPNSSARHLRCPRLQDVLQQLLKGNIRCHIATRNTALKSATARRESPRSLFCLLTWKITSKHEITGGKKPYTPEHVCF